MEVTVVAKEFKHKCRGKPTLFLYNRVAAPKEPTPKEVRQALNVQDQEVVFHIRKAPLPWYEDPAGPIFEIFPIPPCDAGSLFWEDKETHMRLVTEESFFDHLVEAKLTAKVLVLPKGLVDSPVIVGFNKDQVVLRFQENFKDLLFSLFKACLDENFVWERTEEGKVTCTAPISAVEISTPAGVNKQRLMYFRNSNGKTAIVWHATRHGVDHVHLDEKSLDVKGKETLARTEKNLKDPSFLIGSIMRDFLS
jgi:hypothetical protein